MTNPAGLQALQTIMQYLSQVNMSSADLVEAWNEFRVNLDNKIGPLENGSALSVFGRSANSIGPRADIVAASDHQVLRRSGTSVGFGAVDLSQANATTNNLRSDRLPASLSSIYALTPAAGRVPVYSGASTAVLETFETGTWTPSWEGFTTPGTYTYSVQTGNYLRLGHMVYVEFQITLSGITSAGSGLTQIMGLPFTVGNALSSIEVSFASNVAAAPTNFGSYAGTFANPTRIFLRYENSNTGTTGDTNIATLLGSTTQFRGSGWYRAA